MHGYFLILSLHCIKRECFIIYTGYYLIITNHLRNYNLITTRLDRVIIKVVALTFIYSYPAHCRKNAVTLEVAVHRRHYPKNIARPSLISAVSPWLVLVGGNLKHEKIRHVLKIHSVCGRTTLNGMEIGCRVETEWLNRAPLRDGEKEGYITMSSIPFFICNSLFGEHPSSLLPLRFTFSFLFSISSILTCLPILSSDTCCLFGYRTENYV